MPRFNFTFFLCLQIRPIINLSLFLSSETIPILLYGFLYATPEYKPNFLSIIQLCVYINAFPYMN